jgi:hypothetical protein
MRPDQLPRRKVGTSASRCRTTASVTTSPASPAGIAMARNGSRAAPATTSATIAVTVTNWRTRSAIVTQPRRSSAWSGIVAAD